MFTSMGDNGGVVVMLQFTLEFQYQYLSAKYFHIQYSALLTCLSWNFSFCTLCLWLLGWRVFCDVLVFVFVSLSQVTLNGCWTPKSFLFILLCQLSVGRCYTRILRWCCCIYLRPRLCVCTFFVHNQSILMLQLL